MLAADSVGAAYKDFGVLARAYLPEQDVSDGLITIQIVEARFAGLRTDEYTSELVGVDVVESYFEKVQADGSPLPSWLKFDPQRLRFDSEAVPDSAFPMQIVMVVGQERVFMVISERSQ